MPSLFELQQAKIKRTEEFKTKWGTVGKQGTATQTDVVDVLLKKEPELIAKGHSVNLSTYLKEQGIDPKNVPQDWAKPKKQTELREQSVLYGSWNVTPATPKKAQQVVLLRINSYPPFLIKKKIKFFPDHQSLKI